MGGTVRLAERSIHLFAAGSVVPASPLPAYLLPGKFFVVVSLNPDTDHARLVHDLLDDFAVLADDFACAGEKEKKKKYVKNSVIVECTCSDKQYSVVMRWDAVAKKKSSIMNVILLTHLQGSWVPESSLL